MLAVSEVCALWAAAVRVALQDAFRFVQTVVPAGSLFPTDFPISLVIEAKSYWQNYPQYFARNLGEIYQLTLAASAAGESAVVNWQDCLMRLIVYLGNSGTMQPILSAFSVAIALGVMTAALSRDPHLTDSVVDDNLAHATPTVTTPRALPYAAPIVAPAQTLSKRTKPSATTTTMVDMIMSPTKAPPGGRNTPARISEHQEQYNAGLDTTVALAPPAADSAFSAVHSKPPSRPPSRASAVQTAALLQDSSQGQGQGQGEDEGEGDDEESFVSELAETLSEDSERTPSEVAHIQDQPFRSVTQQSIQNPAALIGWRLFVRGYGTGIVLSVKRKRFTTTRFVIQFDNGKVLALALQRSKSKGDVPFTLLSKLLR